ncbi:MAG: NapC/NirT family cytochrome c [Sulfuritalea sp.]|nr:NapC/NirT family cytochrome c [Sulfuritalea sp.]
MADNQKSGFLAMMRRPSAKYSLLSLLVVGFFSGIFFWGGFNTGMEATNTLEFCIGCHEMRDNVYQEYKKTIHYSNRTGVRAVCSDCHVPKDWTHKMIRKIQASKEVWGKINGVINTPEKFAEHRLKMAESEWARMKASDSRECRNCHSFDAMDVEKQKLRGAKMHKIGIDEKKTCIDCHKGIAHTKPKGMKEDEDE